MTTPALPWSAPAAEWTPRPDRGQVPDRWSEPGRPRRCASAVQSGEPKDRVRYTRGATTCARIVGREGPHLGYRRTGAPCRSDVAPAGVAPDRRRRRRARGHRRRGARRAVRGRPHRGPGGRAPRPGGRGAARGRRRVPAGRDRARLAARRHRRRRGARAGLPGGPPTPRCGARGRRAGARRADHDVRQAGRRPDHRPRRGPGVPQRPHGRGDLALAGVRPAAGLRARPASGRYRGAGGDERAGGGRAGGHGHDRRRRALPDRRRRRVLRGGLRRSSAWRWCSTPPRSADAWRSADGAPSADGPTPGSRPEVRPARRRPPRAASGTGCAPSPGRARTAASPAPSAPARTGRGPARPCCGSPR